MPPSNSSIVTFTKDGHSTPLTPQGPIEYLDVFTEMHTQMATFQGSGGTTILISAPEKNLIDERAADNGLRNKKIQLKPNPAQ